MTLQPHVANILIDIIPDMCFVVTAERTVMVYNQRARELLGLPISPRDPIDFYDLLTEDSPRPLLTVLRTEGSADEAEVRFRAPDDETIDAHLFIRRVAGPEKTFLYIVARDVSEAKKKELDLLRFSNVVHYTVNPIQITDAHGRIVYVNPAFEKVTGYAREDLIGANPNIISSNRHSRDFWTTVWESIRKGHVWTGEVENRRRTGEPIFTHLLISPIIDNEGKVVGYLGAHSDITKQKQLEQQLVHSQKMESMGTLAAGIAHEVGNPLASISSIVQVIQRTTKDEDARQKLGLVESQVRRITKIIRDLVDFSRPSNYETRPTDLARILRDSVEIVRMVKKARSIQFAVDVSNSIPLVNLVPDQISQVFLNILLNAVDSVDEKSGRIAVEVSARPETVRVAMADNGSGIAPEHREKIFEPFFTTKPVGKGTGLGLWVSYGIVKSLGGDITFESVRGKGTTFVVTLPSRPAES